MAACTGGNTEPPKIAIIKPAAPNLASSPNLQGYTVNRREHERHTSRNAYQAIHAPHILQEITPMAQHPGHDGQRTQQDPRIEVTQEERTNETARTENGHRYDIILLRQDLGSLFFHSRLHKQARTILDDKSPTHDLRPHVEKLRQYTLTITRHSENTLQSGNKINIVGLVIVTWHLRETDEQQYA